MSTPLPFRLGAAVLLLTASAVVPAKASEAAKLLSADTDVILTLNVRQILDEHKNTDLVQRYLEPWRLALKGDETTLKEYYRDHDLLNSEGITEKQFLDWGKSFKSINDALGMDLLKDVDRVTGGFRKGDRRSLIVIVEGKFKPDKFPAAVEQIAKEHFGSFKKLRMGDAVVWQIPDGGGAYLVLLNDKTLVIAGSKEGLDDVLARSAGKKKDGLSAGIRILLDKCEKEHLAVLVNNLDLFLKDVARFLEEDVVKGLEPRDLVGKLALPQAAALLREQGKDYAAACMGLSIGAAETRLCFGLETKKADRAAELGKQAQAGNLAGGLALMAVKNEVARQLAGILLRAGVSVQDTTVVARATVPHEFVKEVLKSPWLDPAMLGQPSVEAAVRRVTSVRLWGPPEAVPGAVAVEEIRDVAYWDDPKANAVRHRLDLFLPRGKKDYPVVVLVHGGAWMIGDNRCCGLYSSVGHFLASQGIGAVLPNYRLSPSVKHPEHIRDVARAVAWTRKHIADHGGNPERLYLAGHSAGGHLVSLLATDEAYLKAEGLKSTDIKGVIAISGVYRIQHGAMLATLGGEGTIAIRPMQLYPIRGDSVPLPRVPLPGLPLQWNMYGPIFGDDPKQRDTASPVTHVRRGLPPFLILTAENDLPTVSGTADEFHLNLVRAGCEARQVTVAKRNHNTIMFSAIRSEDPVGRAILDFVGKK